MRRAWPVLLFVISGVLASCSGRSAEPQTHASHATTSTTTSVLLPPSTTPSTKPLVAVPDVTGMKIDPARFYLRVAGFIPVPLSESCNKGTLMSQSIVVSLSVPGPLAHPDVGATPLPAGSSRPKGSLIGVLWSTCYPDGTVVPGVTGLKFGAAVHQLQAAGLKWACYTLDVTTTTRPPNTTTTRPPNTTTTRPPNTTTTTKSTGSSSSTTSSTTSSTMAATAVAVSTATSTTAPTLTVVAQEPAEGAKIAAGSSVAISMATCPQ
jgi:beta-lactam-binding protein with PASTA domain